MSTTTTAAAEATGARAPKQGGIFEGLNPTVFNPADPVILFIIQATIVIALTRLLYWPLSKIKEPRVIAEVITGILLGPSVFGRVPGFTDAIFPKEGMAPFRLAANIGLILYLFLVGMEINLTYLLRNWRTAVGVATLDMAIPFGCGVALAYGLYHEFGDDPELAPISFGVFALFIGVAIAITAFPVLCRILTALKLAQHQLYILLVTIGYSLFLAYAVRPCFMWVLRKTHSLENGPTEAVVALTILMVFASAFFTSVIGVHSIFGAFMVGLMCPHEGGFAIKLTEKIEDLISTLFVPLFFALSGINTNLSLLDSGITWGYVVAVTVTAFFTKLFGGTMGARLNGLAKILSPRTFTIFVVMALVTTFLTTPLVSWLYPPSYQRKLELWKQGKIDWDGNPLNAPDADESDESDKDVANRVLVYLRTDGLESPAHGEKSAVSEGLMSGTDAPKPPLRIHGCRLVGLTERNSSVMKVSAIEEFASHDPIIKAFGTSANNTTRDVVVSGQISVVPENTFADTLATEATKLKSDLILVPWSETGTISELPSFYSASRGDPLANGDFTQLMANIFDYAKPIAAVGLFIDSTLLDPTDSDIRPTRVLSRQISGISKSDVQDHTAIRFHSAESRRKKCIRVLYTGSEDDVYAFRLALQFAQNENIDVEIIYLPDKDASEDLHFNQIKSTIPVSIVDRINFTELSSERTATIASSLLSSQPEDKQSTIFILGRSVTALDGDSSGSGSSNIRGTLGSIPSSLANEIKRTATSNVSLLIVQAKQTVPGGTGLNRKPSTASHAHAPN
ncbi:Na-H-Exchanger domain-containing protein [Fusarium sp. LHS14.1]|nr:Na-H-Exchanger domain-containing protein [Fusarium sp. LHS14.1]